MRNAPRCVGCGQGSARAGPLPVPARPDPTSAAASTHTKPSRRTPLRLSPQPLPGAGLREGCSTVCEQPRGVLLPHPEWALRAGWAQGADPSSVAAQVSPWAFRGTGWTVGNRCLLCYCRCPSSTGVTVHQGCCGKDGAWAEGTLRTSALRMRVNQNPGILGPGGGQGRETGRLVPGADTHTRSPEGKGWARLMHWPLGSPGQVP